MGELKAMIAGAVPITPEALEKHFRSRILPVFEADGWRVENRKEPPSLWLTRQQGAIAQQFRFGAYMSGGGVGHVLRTDRTSEYVDMPVQVQLNLGLGFSCDAVAISLRGLLPEDAEYLEADHGSTGLLQADFLPMMKALFPAGRGLDGEWLQETGELEAWTIDFLAWYEREGRAAFDACRDVPSLNRLLHSPWSLQSGPRLGFREMLAVLVLVHFANDREVKFLDWLGVVRKSQASMRSTVRSFEEHPEWHKDGPPRDIRDNEIVDRLIDRLRRRRPANA